ncbi:hypothetical protein Tco_1312285 [Tanacetum coccineum]
MPCPISDNTSSTNFISQTPLAVLKLLGQRKQYKSTRIEKNSVDTEVLLEEEETPTELIEDLRSGEKGEKEISTANVPVSTAGAEVSTASHDISTAAAALVFTSGIRACCEALNKKNQPIHPRSIFFGDKVEVGTTTNNLTARLPILNPGDYDLWLMRIKQYILMTDYSLWEVIKNGNKVLRRTVGTVEQEYEPTTAEEKQDRRNKIKARATLLMALPNKDQLKFHSYQDEKLLMEAIEKRYGWNESKKLEIQGEVINQEDMNLKLLRSLPSKWKTHALIWRNKVEIETISLDDLHNNLKIYEQEITGSSSTSQNSQNVAFVFNNTNNTNSTNKADDTAHRVSTTYSTTHTHGNGVNSICLDNLYDAVICAFLASQPNSSQLSQEDLKQLHPDDLEEMDLQWEMAMLTIRARRCIKRKGKKFQLKLHNLRLLIRDKEKGTERSMDRPRKRKTSPRKEQVEKQREEFAMDFESLAIKFQIIDWKTHVLAKNFMYYQIFRADEGSKNYKIFSEMVDDFDRQDFRLQCSV